MEDSVNIESAGVVQHDSPIPYYFQFCTYVEAKIQAQEWKAGQLLPSEQEFCDLLGVSRTVVRQAMAELKRKGLIAKQNGKRSSIAYPKYEGGLMQTLRGLYEDVAMKGQKLSTQVLKLKVIRSEPEVAAVLGLKEGDPVILLVRLRWLDEAPEVLVTTYIPEKLCPGLVKEDLSNQSLYELLARKYGLTLAQGSRTIEAVALGPADAKLLGSRAGSPVLLLKSVGMLENGTPLEYFVAKHRGDRSKFEVKFVLPRAGA